MNAWLFCLGLFAVVVAGPADPGPTAPQAAAALPELSILLGESNRGEGLKVPSAGDGVNIPVVIDKTSARRVEGKEAHYLYVTIDHPAYLQASTTGPLDVYVVAEIYDEQMQLVNLQYDHHADTPTTASKYTAVADKALLTGTKTWQTCVFPLPGLRGKQGQNNGADFRLSAKGLTVRRLVVSPTKPAGYDPDRPLTAAQLAPLTVHRSTGMELTLGNDATPVRAALLKALSGTSVESYVHWAGVEPQPDRWDWSQWDRQVALLKKNDLKWVPFLLAGPAYATPLWFHEGPDSVYYRCLEHDTESKVQSLFNPKLRPRIERFLQAFADRYRDQQVIESVLLGITGIYGESIYPAGPQGGWTTQLTGTYHNHAGWWAGDPYAAAAFREAMQSRYGTREKLNTAWGTTHATFAEVRPFLPEKAPNDQARADFVEWYQQAMTDWAVFWVQATRKVFAHTPIYLCTGGDGTPMLGADFTAQAFAIAPFGAGIRVTNEASDYAQNFTLTREVATATRHAGSFCGFEPAGPENEQGVAARLYNATASGARQWHDYWDNLLNQPATLARFRQFAPRLTPRQPVVTVALYLPRETWALDPPALHRIMNLAKTLREVTDFDFITRRTTKAEFLQDYHIVILAEAPVLDPRAAAALEAWVRAGGTLLATTRPHEVLGSRLDDQRAWRERLFHAVASPRSVGQGRTLLFAGQADDSKRLAEMLVTLLPHAVDGKVDGRFATVTSAGVLWLDPAAPNLWETALPPR